MRVILAVGVVVLAGCTVTVDVDDTAPPSEFYQDFDFAALAATIPGGDERAAGASGSGSQGMTTHDGRKYYRRAESLRLEMPAGEQAHFLGELRLELKNAIDATDVRVQGEGRSADGDDLMLEGFSFEYASEDVFGWVDVDVAGQADQLALKLYIHEAEI